jgi:hypothetical protein
MAVIVYGPTINAVNNEGHQEILVSTADPVVGNGKNGDIWIKYTP